MIIHGQFYDGIVGKPDLDDALEHYGVLGMKWGVRKDLDGAYLKATKKSEKLGKKIEKANKKYLKKAKLGRLPITVVSKRSVQNARSKVDLLINKKKKWDEFTDKEMAKAYQRRDSEHAKLASLPPEKKAKVLSKLQKQEDKFQIKRQKREDKFIKDYQKGKIKLSAEEQKIIFGNDSDFLDEFKKKKK